MKNYIVVKRGRIVERIEANDWFEAVEKSSYSIHSVDIIQVDENDDPIHE